jgi:predicted peroxiredoxin
VLVFLVAATAASAAWIGCQPAKEQPVAQTPAPKAPVFVMLTSGLADVPRYTMALGVAETALTAGRDVVVFLDVHASELACKEDSGEPFVVGRRMDAMQEMDGGVPPRDQLKSLMTRGAKVFACRMCMMGLKTDEAALIEGVGFYASNDELLAKADGATVLSY